MLYRISVTERGLTGIANIFRSRLSRLDDLLGAGDCPFKFASHLRFVLFVCLFISIMDMQYEMVIRMDRHKSKQLNSRHLSNKIPKNKVDIRH